MIRHFLNPPNWFTSASIFCAVWAMTTLLGAGVDPEPGVLIKACVLVVFGGIFDLLDGRVARLTKRFTEFGVQLDSIADIISFGVVPALLVWSWKLHALGPLGNVLAFGWVLCAAFRLARFNAELEEGDESWPYNGYARGLTSTMAGGALVTFVWVSNGYLVDRIEVPAIAVGGVVAAMAFLMISSLPLPDFRDLRRNRFARHITAGFLAICLTGLVFDPALFFGMGAAIYLTYGVAEGLFAVFKHKRSVADDEEYVRNED